MADRTMEELLQAPPRKGMKRITVIGVQDYEAVILLAFNAQRCENTYSKMRSMPDSLINTKEAKKEFDQAGDALATASYPFIAEATAHLYAFLEVLLLKKSKSLRAKPAPSTSKPSSLKVLNPVS
uniref:Uncharacterized protein n=1 Tax=Tanacetum cinerariifolium TaxID=118510 RepID=A0A6L2NKQ5_TANCI|nr:hypothetical protein [Tanacetum cinerariifolium]